MVRVMITPSTQPVAQYAAAGSQRWLQLAVNGAPHILDAALRKVGAIEKSDSVRWTAPLAADRFAEPRDSEVLRRLEIDGLPKRSLADFWPRRGPVWDALGVTYGGAKILIEAKAHIAEAASPGSKASPGSLKLILQSLAEARKFYAPRAKADWHLHFYQYANRLAFQYLFNELNGLDTRLIFLDFVNDKEMGGPVSEAEWQGATRLIHAVLGLPADLRRHGVFHAYVDVGRLNG